MSRRSRRAAVIRSGVPEVIGRPFDDSGDPFSVPESVPPLPGVDLWPDSPAITPSYPAAPAGLPRRSPGLGPGVRGRMPLAKPLVPLARRLPDVSRVVRVGPPFHAKQIGKRGAQGDERRRSLFNVVVSPFSKRVRHCVKRKQRREVLFALRSGGRINRRSPGAGGTYRRRVESQWRC